MLPPESYSHCGCWVCRTGGRCLGGIRARSSLSFWRRQTTWTCCDAIRSVAAELRAEGRGLAGHSVLPAQSEGPCPRLPRKTLHPLLQEAVETRLWHRDDHSLGTVAAGGGGAPTLPSVLCRPFLSGTATSRGAGVSEDPQLSARPLRDASRHRILHQASVAPGTRMPSMPTGHPVGRLSDQPCLIFTVSVQGKLCTS